MTDKTRPVEVIVAHDIKIPGRFLRWADSVTYDEGNNPIPMTVALVEKDDGRVIEVVPREIKFLDR